MNPFTRFLMLASFALTLAALASSLVFLIPAFAALAVGNLIDTLDE